jgi:hypothetical protein
VTISPVGAPLIWIIVLSPVVVPCTIVSVCPSSASRLSPSAAAAWVSALMTPSLWSPGVVGAFSSRRLPSGRITTQSVKVPPTSTPIR